MNTQERLLIDNLENFYLFEKTILNINTQITFGLEIEFQNVLLSYLRSNFDLSFWTFEKEEKTISKECNNDYLGGEAITKICKDSKQDWKEIKKLLEFIKESEGYVNSYCGGHIHIGKNILEENEKYLTNFFKLWTVYEDIIFRFGNGNTAYGRKYQAEYAKPASIKLYELLERNNFSLKYRKIINFSAFMKHYAIDLTKFCEENGTIEFRNPNATLDIELWQNHVLFFVSLLNAAKSDSTNFDIINKRLREYKKENYQIENYQYSNIEKAIELSDLIYTNYFDKVCFLKEYTKKGSLVKKRNNT